MKGRNALATLSLLIAASASAADDQPRTPIYLAASAQGDISRQFIYYMREGLRASRGMSLSDSDETLHQLRIVAMDDSPNGLSYSLVWTYSGGKQLPAFLNHTVGICGADSLRDCVDNVLASTDHRLSEESKTWSELLKGLDFSKPSK